MLRRKNRTSCAQRLALDSGGNSMHRRVDRVLPAAITLLTIVAALHSPTALAADRVRFALPGNSMGYLPLIVAIHRGFFKEESIDLELIRLVPTVAHNALL